MSASLTGAWNCRKILGSLMFLPVLLAASCTVHVWPPYRPPPDATVPITVIPGPGEKDPLGTELIVEGKIYYIEDQSVFKSSALLIPGQLNCIAIGFGQKTKLWPFDPYHLATHVFVLYPHEGDVLTVQATTRQERSGLAALLSKPSVHMTVTNQGGKVVYSGWSKPNVSYPTKFQPEVQVGHIAICERELLPKVRDYFEDD